MLEAVCAGAGVAAVVLLLVGVLVSDGLRGALSDVWQAMCEGVW